MTKIITRKNSLDDFCSGIAQSYGVNRPQIHLSNSGKIYEVHKGKSNLAVKLGGAIALVELISQLASPVVAEAANLTINAYNQQGDALPGVEVIATDGSGSTKLNTDGFGTAVFNKTGDTELRIAKDNYLGAKQTFTINSDTTLHAPLVSKEYIRNGTDTTGVDTIETRADEMKSVHHVDNIQKNPILMNVEANWSNFNIPVMISSSFSDIDSQKIRDWLTWRNNYSGKILFNFVAFDTTAGSTEQGIYMYPGTSNSTQITPTGDGKYIQTAGCKLTTPVSYISILKEASYRALTFPSGNDVIYHPTNYLGEDKTQPKDEAYMMIAYQLQHLKEIGKNNLDMDAIADSLAPTGVAGNPPEMTKYLSRLIKGVYPLPAKNYVNIECSFDKSEHLKVDVYNLQGQKVASLYDGNVSEGIKTLKWNVNNNQYEKTASGIYILRAQTEKEQATKKIVVVR